jgi:enoyl-CoA hydratase/carnithine racemase
LKPVAGEDAPVLASRDGGVLTLTLNRPPTHSLSLPMIGALRQELDRARHEPGVKVIVIAASGRIFCAGHDLKDMRAHRKDPDGGRAYFEQLFGECSEMLKSIARHPRPVIAAVDGVATAAGCQLVASADLAFASERSVFATPGVNIGGFCSTPMVALSRNVSQKHAMEMLLSGEMIDARRAFEIGLVNRVVATEKLNQAVSEFAQLIASKSSSAIARGKRAFYAQLAMPLAQAYEFSAEVMVEGFMTGDSDEGVDAFLTKRHPRWKED